jgi:fatty acid desaturase
MSSQLNSAPQFASLSDPDFKRRLQTLRQADNYHNWFYLLRTYTLIACAFGGTVWCYHEFRDTGTSLLWFAPIFFVAVVLMGALQHHLANLAHEAVHHALFRSRYLNDLIGEWFCSFPMFSTTYLFALHHLAHHQFVNDPARDPDISQLQKSGHQLSFPVLRDEFLDVLLRQMWVPNLVRYSLTRAEYDSVGTTDSPYIRADWKFTKLPAQLSLAYLVLLGAAIAGSVAYRIPTLLAALPIGLWAAFMVVLKLLPERCYYQSKIRPLITVRTLSMMRITFLGLVFSAIGWAAYQTSDRWAFYFAMLWALPLLTTFPLFMVLRQIVQHGNSDRGWLTNTRVFLCHPVINFAVFPLGQEYHLPHHMFSSVPHYRLKALHDLMMQTPEYRDQITVVEGYFRPKHLPQQRPTVVDVLGPEYTPREFHDAFIDNSVLDDRNVTDAEKSQLSIEGAQEAARLRRIATNDNGPDDTKQQPSLRDVA